MASAVAERSGAVEPFAGEGRRNPLRLLRGRERAGRVLAWPLVRLGGCLLLIGGGLSALALAGGAVGVALGALFLLVGGIGVGWAAGIFGREALRTEIADRSHELHQALAQLELAQAETVRKLSLAVELRDEDTGAHIERIGRLSALLAQRLGKGEAYCSRLLYAAPLHDVGKVAIPDAILLKPGPLTPEERAVVQSHAEEGYRLLSHSSSAILEMAATIALTHHERWDGHGYPQGLRGDAIPLEGRIVAVTDVFDALTSDRVYRKAYPLAEAVALMRSERGRHFDPRVLDAFLELIGAGGTSARPYRRPQAWIAGLAEVLSKALEQGDGLLAEGVVSQAIEDGIPATKVHGELVAPAIRRIYRLRAEGELGLEEERRACALASRVLATLARLMEGNQGTRREQVVVGAPAGEQRTLELQIAREQLAGAGFQVETIADLGKGALGAQKVVPVRPAAALVIGATEAIYPALVKACAEVRERWPGLPVLVSGGAAKMLQGQRGVITIEQAEHCAGALQSLLDSRSKVTAVPGAR